MWASQLLGMFRAKRYDLPFAEAVQADPPLLYGEPLIRQLVRTDDPGAALAVAA